MNTEITKEVIEGAALFICYLIDNCEREVITEEFLQNRFGDFIKSQRVADSTRGEG